MGISRVHGLAVADLVIVDPGAIPITTSGKIRRSGAVEKYRNNEFTRLDTFQKCTTAALGPLSPTADRPDPHRRSQALTHACRNVTSAPGQEGNPVRPGTCRGNHRQDYGRGVGSIVQDCLRFDLGRRTVPERFTGVRIGRELGEVTAGDFQPDSVAGPEQETRWPDREVIFVGLIGDCGPRLRQGVAERRPQDSVVEVDHLPVGLHDLKLRGESVSTTEPRQPRGPPRWAPSPRCPPVTGRCCKPVHRNVVRQAAGHRAPADRNGHRSRNVRPGSAPGRSGRRHTVGG